MPGLGPVGPAGGPGGGPAEGPVGTHDTRPVYAASNETSDRLNIFGKELLLTSREWAIHHLYMHSKIANSLRHLASSSAMEKRRRRFEASRINAMVRCKCPVSACVNLWTWLIFPMQRKATQGSVWRDYYLWLVRGGAAGVWGSNLRLVKLSDKRGTARQSPTRGPLAKFHLSSTSETN